MQDRTITKVRLWAIKEFLSGNEDKIISTIPILQFPDTVKLVDNLDWVFSSEQGLISFDPFELVDFVTVVESLKEILIAQMKCLY